MMNKNFIYRIYMEVQTSQSLEWLLQSPKRGEGKKLFVGEAVEMSVHSLADARPLQNK